MEKLPQRPAIIDSLQPCSLLGTFTNKGRPINISHADQGGNWEFVGVRAKDEVRKCRQEMYLACFYLFIYIYICTYKSIIF